MSFVPLSRSQLEFIAEEFWPGGGENGDGRDLYGVAKHEGKWVEETLDADLIAEALHPSDAAYEDRFTEEEVDREFDEMETDADGERVFLNGKPLDSYDDLPDGEDGSDTLELALTRQIAIDPWCVVVPRRWNEDRLLNNEGAGSELEDIGAAPSGPGVANALECFERDGVTKVSMRCGIGGTGEYRDSRRRRGPNIKPHNPDPNDPERTARFQNRVRFDSWKRHRPAQYRLRQLCPRITDRIAA